MSRTSDLVLMNCSPFIFETFCLRLVLFLFPPGISKSQIVDAKRIAVASERREGGGARKRERGGGAGRRTRQAESRSERGNLAKGCKTSEKEHQESVKCANHGAVIGGNYDNSIPRARAVLRAGMPVQQHACERGVHTRIYGVSGDRLLLSFIAGQVSNVGFASLKVRARELIVSIMKLKAALSNLVARI